VGDDQPDRHLAGLYALPEPPHLLDWATDRRDGANTPPVGVDLDDDPAAICRLLAFIDPTRRVPLYDAFAPSSPPNRTVGSQPTATEG
jgi:hypothetical protein